MYPHLGGLVIDLNSIKKFQNDDSCIFDLSLKLTNIMKLLCIGCKTGMMNIISLFVFWSKCFELFENC